MHTHKEQRHAVLFGGRSKKAQVYPEALCEAICRGIKRQIELDKTRQFIIATLEAPDSRKEEKAINAMLNNRDAGNEPAVCEDQEAELQQAWDDVSGKDLDPKMVRDARAEEMQHIKKTNLYTKVPRSKALKIGQKIVGVRWIDINKGDLVNLNYRSRLVAKEFNNSLRPDLFAATPPLEALKLIISMAMTENPGEKIMVNDVSRAFFCAPARRQVFVELPPEDADHKSMIGELNFSMYGTRDAAQNWGEECAGTMTNAGFIRGKASPCTFYHPDKNLRTYIHGDDYVTVGKEADLKWLRNKLEEKYEIKTQVLGPDKGDSQQIRILNRILTWTEKGIEYEADPRHAEIVIKELGLEDAKSVVTPGTKDEGTTKPDCEEALPSAKASEHRAHTARLNYLSADRPDISYSVKELARAMSAPTNGCWDKLKRLGR